MLVLIPCWKKGCGRHYRFVEKTELPSLVIWELRIPSLPQKKTAAIAADLGLPDLKIAAVLGDDVLDILAHEHFSLLESGDDLDSIRDRIISANAYLGVAGILEALVADADVILTGRAADPALFLAPMIHEFEWPVSDYELLGKGTSLGHLMECAGQITGGYFADPGYKEVPNLANLGFPIAEVQADGRFFITKLPDAGGIVSAATCKEQLLYEIHNPGSYFTPDLIADFTKVEIRETGKDQVAISGGRGKAPSGYLKVSIGYRDGFVGEGQISYGGSNALARARLASAIVKDRLQQRGLTYQDLRREYIGVNHLYGSALPTPETKEVRVRIVARTDDYATAQKIGNEVETLYTNGPAGGGGVTKSVQEIIAIQSVLLPKERVQPQVKMIHHVA